MRVRVPVASVSWPGQVAWSELFTDLVIVAVALQMSSAIKRDLSWPTLAFVSTSFLIVFMGWHSMAAYVSRFPQNHLVYVPRHGGR